MKKRTTSLADEIRWTANDAAARWLARHDKTFAARKRIKGIRDKSTRIRSITRRVPTS